MSNGITQALEDAARKIAQAAEDAGKTVVHFFEDTGDRLEQSVKAHVEHDEKASSDLENAGRHSDETPHVHGGGSSPTRPEASGGGSGGPDVVAETDRAAWFGNDVKAGLARHQADPRLRGRFPDGYDTLHGQSPEEYLRSHTKNPPFDSNGYPNYDWEHEAPNHGALGDEEQTHLPVGHRIDRFGGTGGRFLSPIPTDYPQRGLPADTLTRDYHQYEVIKPLPVHKGVVSPAFGEPGLGVQYRTNGRVQWYIQHGYLREIK